MNDGQCVDALLIIISHIILLTSMIRCPPLMVQYRLGGPHGRILNATLCELSHQGPDGMPVEKARLVYNYASDNGEVFQELSYSNVTKPLHWKAFIHASLVDGATIYRRDVVNAHQSVRRGADLEPCYTFGIPGISMLDESGCECDIMWFNYLNGMPPVGAAFSSDLAAHLSGFSMRPIITDDYVYVRFDDLANVGTDYCKACLIVDDMLVAVKGKVTIDMFDLHMEKRWAMKKFLLDGFLNNQFYSNIPLNTVTMCMDVRITEIMKEHLPDEMVRLPGFYPKTPNHPDMMSLSLAMPKLDNDRAKASHRLGCQLMYVVVQVYYPAQFAVFYAARFSSVPSELYEACNLYILRHIYSTRHIGLTLGGNGDAELVASGCMREGTHRGPTESGMYADAGHAQAGPSTGGYTVELGSTTLHAVSGQHHATTLGTSDSESYEVSRAVATALAFRSFMTEFGFPQRLPTEVKNDNSGTVAKAASDASDKRSLYMKRRVKFVQEAQKLGEVLVVYVQSAANRADILTKPVSAKIFDALRDAILNVRRTAMNIHRWVSAKVPL